MNGLTAEDANRLLDFNQKLDIGLLDTIVHCMYSGHGNDQQMAQSLLTRFKEHPDAWTRVDTILEYASNQQTKFYALQILENVIKTRWKSLPSEQCEGIKTYIVRLIIRTSQDRSSFEKERAFLSKLNMILVQILKHEWPQKWPNFISEIVGASTASEYLCQNNMIILRLLSEEVFDFSSGAMTQAKAKHLKETMCQEFSQIFQLCQSVFERSANSALIRETLQTLLRFLNWIPLGYVFETRLIHSLVERFLAVAPFRNITLQCLTEIAGIQAPQYDSQFVDLFQIMMVQLTTMIPPSIDIRLAYQLGQDDEQKFIHNLALFLSTILREHGTLIEKAATGNQSGRTGGSGIGFGSAPQLSSPSATTPGSGSGDTANYHKAALNYLAAISEVDDQEVFKICLEYWDWLAAELYRDSPLPSLLQPAALFGPPTRTDTAVQRRLYYADVLSRVRRVMISRMAKPEEVLVVENEAGEVVREFMKDTDAIELYKNMRETLVYLTHLDYQDTEAIMLEKLHRQIDGSEWSWKNLNSLCWAVGSVSGAMHEEDEKRFLVTVIRELLGMCEKTRGKDNKAIVASNIMYVVGQYPRFLRAHWKFLKTVVNKLFEFMHETHEGVQDMACDTFIKIANKCRRQFVVQQVGEQVPFIDEIISNIPTTVCDLEPQQVQTFFEAVGIMLSAVSDSGYQAQLVERAMALPNSVFDTIISQAVQNVQILCQLEPVRQLANILRTNARVCMNLGDPYLSQLRRIYMDVLNVYKVMSENINEAVRTGGEAATKQQLIRAMRAVKKDSLKLIAGFVSKCSDLRLVADHLLPPLLDAVLFDYQRNIPAAREPEVLSAMAQVISRLGAIATPQVPLILDAVFECTLSMIDKNFEEYPEHRTCFFQLLSAVQSSCFNALIALSPVQFKLVLDAVIWACKHVMRDVSETGLQVLFALIKQLPATDDAAAQRFFAAHYLDLLHHLLTIVTDSSHSYAFSYHCQIMAFMFVLVETGQVKVNLAAPPSGITPAGVTPYSQEQTATPEQNVTTVQQFLTAVLHSAFPHINAAQLEVFMKGLFSFDQDIAAFKEHVRDFLVQIREFRGQDNSDLYLEEREQAIKRAQEEKRQQQLQVPGILNPHEMPDVNDMND